jgi:type I restriction enzyme S subunit
VRIVDSALGPIPEGWVLRRLGDVLAVLESGSRPKGGVSESSGDVPSIGAENIIGLGQYDYSKEKYVTRAYFESMRRGLVQDLDVLLYKDGAQIGRKSLFGSGFPHDVCCVNEHVFILRTHDCCSQWFLYFWFDQRDVTQQIRNLNANAAQPGINQAGVRSVPILLPPREVIDAFDEIAISVVRQIFNLAKKNNNLRKTRDLLLPRLVSGEVDVSDLDIKTEEPEP